MTDEARRIVLYQSQPRDCSYLPGHQSSSLFVDPSQSLNSHVYAALLERGFRRSGSYVYRPHCPDCNQCKATRLPVERFHPRRSQRRVLRHNKDLQVSSIPAGFSQEHFALYRRYLNGRHPDGEMAGSTPEQYLDFLISSWCETRLIEFRLDDQLLAVAVTDILPDALSAVYTFFDPAFEGRSPGVFAILSQIEMARDEALPWFYLGYWIRDCGKMRYKTDYRPLEIYHDHAWRLFEGN